jgi:type III pantothenate kinase
MAATPSILLVDIGNTRVKWAVLARGRIGRLAAAEHSDWNVTDYERRVLAPASRRAQITRVFAASVAGETVDAFFERAVERALGIATEWTRSRRRAAGVVNGYREPWRLGVDRWVAVIGANHLYDPPRAVCVADAGTALTIDLVDAQGRHRGGAIVPGADLMVRTLLEGTSGIRRRASRRAPRDPPLFARDTRAALESGARHAAAALVERAAAQACERLQQRVELVLTGGAAEEIGRAVHVPFRLVPDLVLRGLAALAGFTHLR